MITYFRQLFMLITLVLTITAVHAQDGSDFVSKWQNTGPDGTIISYVIHEDMTYEIDFNADGVADIKGKMEIMGDRVQIEDTEGQTVKKPLLSLKSSLKNSYVKGYQKN